MTVRELKDILEDEEDDAPVCYLLEQHRTNLKYDICDIAHPGANADERYAGIVFLLGDSEDYGPRDVETQ